VFGSVYAGGPERPSRRSTSRSTTSYPEPHRPAPEARASLSRAYSDVVTASPSWPTTTTPRVGSWRARSIAALTASRSRQPTRHAVTLDDGLARFDCTIYRETKPATTLSSCSTCMPWITRSREARWTSTTADSAASPRRHRYVVATHVRPALGQGSSSGSAGQADEPEGTGGRLLPLIHSLSRPGPPMLIDEPREA
jgi:hypothetical protein